MIPQMEKTEPLLLQENVGDDACAPLSDHLGSPRAACVIDLEPARPPCRRGIIPGLNPHRRSLEIHPEPPSPRPALS